ncbi:unnamed protein product [Macrosiphum euphorbiae]|uniref:Uncharacterized protein n=1 Tax=Macrosiphum euphorbiae TaxID=13131 RepID=A0AAV0VPV4_9HEMI|nr:unnamed protein product [Macrosiphum euphorbiae]
MSSDGWLAKSKKGEFHFHCIACGFDGVAGKSEIKKHAAGLKHNRVVDGCQQSLISLPSVSKRAQLVKSVKLGELHMAAFIAEHNLPFTVMNHLPKYAMQPQNRYIIIL